MKQWKYTVCAGEAGCTLVQILKAAGFSKKEISRQKFIPEGITLDGEKCRITRIVQEGQEIVLNLREMSERDADMEERAEHESEAEVDLGQVRRESGLLPEILYEDDALLIVNKPSGLSCHPGRGHYHDNLGSIAMNYCRSKGENFPIRQIGRLDKDTSGIVVFAKDKVAAARLWKQRENGTFTKTYHALVHGGMKEQSGTIDLPMMKIPGEKNKMCAVSQRAVVQKADAPVCKTEGDASLPVRAATHYRVIRKLSRSENPLTLVECTLDTGRTHQIRVHMAAMGHPLAGDRLYGKEDKADRLCLHAAAVRLVQPYTGQAINIITEEKRNPDETGTSDFSY